MVDGPVNAELSNSIAEKDLLGFFPRAGNIITGSSSKAYLRIATALFSVCVIGLLGVTLFFTLF